MGDYPHPNNNMEVEHENSNFSFNKYRCNLTDIELLTKFAERQNLSTCPNITIFLKSENGFQNGNPLKLKENIMKEFTIKKNILSISKTRNSEIIIKTNNCETAKEALKIKEINRVKISTRLSFTGLTTSYILHGIDTEYTIDDIKSELENYNYAIFDIQRFTKKTESGFKPIKTVKVIQIGCSIPERVPIGFEMIKTTLYYEKPRQCTNCWKFGHLQKFCRSAIKCRICSLNHSVNECKEIQIKKCSSCGEGHEANDTDCKRYKEEIEILKIKVQQQISRNEAVEKFQREKKTSYSAKTYNDQTEKIENLEKKLAKLEMKFEETNNIFEKKLEETNNIFEKKLEEIVQLFTSELNTVVAQINLRFSSLMNTMESTLKKVASNITIQKDDDCIISRKQNEKAKKIQENIRTERKLIRSCSRKK
ncbi:uncharacterized protein TNCV_3880191 [Trichonephila clavipes]|nr:uncharacterized protein TNCV_3880191 [Trichonephila clavipes]